MAFSETLIMAAANAAPRGVEWLIRTAATTEVALKLAQTATEHTLRRVRKLERIGIVSDTNIGDAVVLQGACSVFKRLLPDCEIDYFYQAKARPLLQLNPDIYGHHPVFTDPDFTSANNRRAVQAAIQDREYDLILNLYPFLMNSELRGAHCPVLVPYGLITGILEAEKNPAAIAHVSYRLCRYVESIAERLAGATNTGAPPPRPEPNVLYLSPEVPARAAEVLRTAGIKPDARLAFVNPDSSSRFSRIPLKTQAELVYKLLDLDCFDHVLVGPAYSFPEAADRLCAEAASHSGHRKLVRLPQNIPIDTYAGLIDCARLFITSDTAQMHIAAARRMAAGARAPAFRNNTMLLTIFGATNSRIYGYDSSTPGYLDSNQDAPARVFEGTPRCKNLTCIHKTHKNCPTVECFAGLDMNRIWNWIHQWSRSSDQSSARAHKGEAESTELMKVTDQNRHPPHLSLPPDMSAPIIVVSGLPRSGTSLMMQMLIAGGVEAATDGVRTPDEDNPHGYYELERVKSLTRDASWLKECRGKAVKIISMLLDSLPDHHAYHIIFMERSLPEVLASQKRMQQRRGTADPGENDDQLTTLFRQHLDAVKQALPSRPNVRTQYVSYRSVVGSPRLTAEQICEFLRRDLDIEAMVKAVDSKLYRHREPAAQR